MIKATDIELTNAYAKYGNVWRVADVFNMCGQSVQERLKKLNIDLNGNGKKWTETETTELIRLYVNGFKRGDGKLDEFCNKFNRTKQYVSRKANQLNLTSPTRALAVKEKNRISSASTEWLKNNNHPKGFSGCKHTDSALLKISNASIISHANMTQQQKIDKVFKMMKTKHVNGTMVPNRPKTTWKAGWREIGGYKKYYRSQWEANYARYLEWLKENNQIKAWLHEPDTFWFDGVKRGCVSYLPDFKVTENNGDTVYHEVKGWMGARSKTKIKRMKKYHPGVTLIVIDAKPYKEISKKLGRLIPGWE